LGNKTDFNMVVVQNMWRPSLCRSGGQETESALQCARQHIRSAPFFQSLVVTLPLNSLLLTSSPVWQMYADYCGLELNLFTVSINKLTLIRTCQTEVRFQPD
jgi:hypothetical protein